MEESDEPFAGRFSAGRVIADRFFADRFVADLALLESSFSPKENW
jgi:hypothetical protein